MRMLTNLNWPLLLDYVFRLGRKTILSLFMIWIILQGHDALLNKINKSTHLVSRWAGGDRVTWEMMFIWRASILAKVSWLADVQLRRRTGNSQVVTLPTSVNLNGWHSPAGKVTKTWVMPTAPSSFPRPTRTPLTVLFQHRAPSAIMNQPDSIMESKPVDDFCPMMEYHFENHSLGWLRKSTNLYHARSPKYWLHSFKLTI